LAFSRHYKKPLLFANYSLETLVERFSRFPQVKAVTLKYAKIPNPKDHKAFWDGIWGKPVEPNKGKLAVVLDKCNFKQVSPVATNETIKSHEIATAIQYSAPWKATGPDGVYANILKRLVHAVVPILTRLFNELWIGKTHPEEWFAEGKTILFLKNDGSIEEPKNFRPITMLNSLYKVYTSVLEARIIRAMTHSGNWDTDQMALRKRRRGCLDAHLINEVIIQSCRKITRSPIHTAFLDFQKAYDSVSHTALLEVLGRALDDGRATTSRLLRALKELMSKWNTYLVNTEGEKETIFIRRGIFQGDKMSPTLFCAALSVLRSIKQNMQIGAGDKIGQAGWLCYMDDIKLFAESMPKLDQIVGNTKKVVKLIGLVTNDGKSGIVSTCTDAELAESEALKEFPRFDKDGKLYKYLGIKQSWENSNQTKFDAMKLARKRIRKIIYHNLTIINIGKALGTYV